MIFFWGRSRGGLWMAQITAACSTASALVGPAAAPHLQVPAPAGGMCHVSIKGRRSLKSSRWHSMVGRECTGCRDRIEQQKMSLAV